ncbi:MAG TPA: CoA transferase [Thermohalobaculum sp.]|nr:CoA transferase [Thermohalobaculum sp.]
MSASDQRPLSGIRVLDFGQYLAGPLVGMMLADFGAGVIRVDPPEGSRWRDPAFDMLSRGKKGIVLNLNSPSDAATAKALAARSDVVIENFRPGVMARLGLDAATLREGNPGLVYLSLPGFASTDPELAQVPAWEAVIAARTGQFTDMGLNRVLMGINPSFTPLALASAYGAVFGAMSVLFALAARGRMGGDAIEVPLASALFEGLAYNSERIEGYPDRYKSPREREIDRRRAAGEAMDMSFADLQGFLDPFYRTYRCADGRGFYVVAASHREHPKRVLRALGLDALLANLPDFDVYTDHKNWPGPWSLRSYPVGAADRARLTRAMEAAFLTRPAVEWEQIFGAEPAPATTQRTTPEWLAEPHALASGLIVEVDDPRHGRMRQMGNVAWLGGDEGALTKTPSPAPDQHREEILAALAAESPPPPPIPTIGLGRDGERGTAKSSPNASGWLTGIRVLDLTNVIAGPTIASTMARFGAEVTQIGTIEPSMDPWNGVVFGLHANRGKKNLLLDIRSPEGRQAFDQLLSQADVVTFNGTDLQRDRLGLNPDALALAHPRLILVQLDAWGGPARGPKSDHLGYDDLAQAATGVMARFGGGLDTPEEHAHLGTIDVLTGFCACVALGAALVRREVTGKGGLARTSLAAAGNLIQAPFMYDFNGRAPFIEPSGREVKGWGPFYHCYEAADGWFFLAAPIERAVALGRVLELADLAHLPETELTEALMDRFIAEPVAHWQATLAQGTTAVMPLATLAGTRDDALVSESARGPDIAHATFRAIRHDRHPMGRWVDLVAPNAVRPQNAHITIPAPAPKYGADTRTVLARLGYDDTKINQMIADRVAATSWSDKYLPE